MKILFAGSPAIAVPALEAVREKHTLVGVLTNPDKPSGRGRSIASTPVKLRAESLGLPLFQPIKIDSAFHETTASLKADILVVVAYGKIFPESYLSLFPKGGINLHPSLLPKYRGPSPISAAIKDGCTETGVTIQRLAKKMDCGNILAQERIPILPSDTTESLTLKAGQVGARMLVEVLQLLEEGREMEIPQWDGDASYCFLITPEEAEILWTSPAKEICCQIRAFYPWPKARTSFNSRTLYFLDAEVYNPPDNSAVRDEGQKKAPSAASSVRGGEEPVPGRVIGIDKREGILVQTGEGILAVKKLQLAGKNPLGWKEFLNGVRDFPGTVLGGD